MLAFALRSHFPVVEVACPWGVSDGTPQRADWRNAPCVGRVAQSSRCWCPRSVICRIDDRPLHAVACHCGGLQVSGHVAGGFSTFDGVLTRTSAQIEGPEPRASATNVTFPVTNVTRV